MSQREIFFGICMALITAVTVCFISVQMRGCEESNNIYWIERNISEGKK